MLLVKPGCSVVKSMPNDLLFLLGQYAEIIWSIPGMGVEQTSTFRQNVFCGLDKTCLHFNTKRIWPMTFRFIDELRKSHAFAIGSHSSHSFGRRVKRCRVGPRFHFFSWGWSHDNGFSWKDTREGWCDYRPWQSVAVTSYSIRTKDIHIRMRFSETHHCVLLAKDYRLDFVGLHVLLYHW